MKIKTQDLIGPALDRAVAKALGWIDYPTDSIEKGRYWHTDPNKAPWGERISKVGWTPSVDRNQGGPIIERERISVWNARDVGHDFSWGAYRVVERKSCYDQHGDTPLIAAMRCYVASKLGDEVDVPEGLL